MMQEVAGEDTNGSESTFEFVEGKLDEMHIAPASVPAPSAPGHPQSDGERSHGVTSGSAPTTPLAVPPPVSTSAAAALPNPVTPIFSNVSPPAALPSFLVQPLVSGSSVPPPIPVTQTFFSPLPSVPVSSQPVLTPPMATSTSQYAEYSPPRSNSAGQAEDLPLPTYDYANSLSAISEGGPPGGGVWGWIKGSVSGNEFLHKVAEKAKSSVDNMITTLDPQMKEYIFSGGDIDIIVASDKEDKIAPIREAFQVVFGRASVTGHAAQAEIAAQPVGHFAGLKGAEDRIKQLRQSGAVHERQPIVALENFLAELTPDRWFDIGCLFLSDPELGSDSIQVYTQATPVPLPYVQQMVAETPAEYPFRWSGFAVPVGTVMGRALQVPHSEWHLAVSGHSRRSLILMAAKTLAHLYKEKRESIVASASGWQ